MRTLETPGGRHVSRRGPTRRARECRSVRAGLRPWREPTIGGEVAVGGSWSSVTNKACQIHLRAPEGIALTTELHRPENTPRTPQDIWLMTCNHADGDKNAKTKCRSALAGFRFRDR